MVDGLKEVTMSLLSLIVTLAVIGGLVYLVNTYIPMSPTLNKVFNVAVLFGVVVWLLNVFGLLSGVAGVHVGQ